MLLELVVENYAVVDRLRVRFHPGLNLLTGETGSGKSIVVDALGLLLGGRASAESIRSGEIKARVAGIFDVQNDAGVRSLLDASGFDMEEGELLIEREILAGGKSRAYIGSRPAAVALLKELAPFLGDIHGQHDQQLLFSSAAQLEMLDSYAGAAPLLEKVAGLFKQWKRITSDIEELEKTEQEKLRLLDMWEFQRKEIEALGLHAGEDTTLENERRVLQNMGRLQESAGTAYAAVYDSPESAVALTRVALKRLDELCKIDATLEPIRENLRNADLALQEASFALRDYVGDLESNPGRLEEVENRLASLDRLKRKYGGSLEEVLAYLDKVREQIAAVENAGETMERLRKEQIRASAEYERVSGELSAKRREAAVKLGKAVERELDSLAMERAVFTVAVSSAPWSETGADRVEFLISPNLGEEPRPIEKVASGGEISRVALALKSCLQKPARKSGSTRTLVFDEVDTGIGGSVAEGVGKRLKALAGTNQVLCVTHLAQIASFADHHYRVEKKERDGRTVAQLEELDQESRTREVGRMLSGQRLTPEALKHAEQLIRMSAI